MKYRKSNRLLDDKIMAGVILGWFSNIPKMILDTIMYKLGFSKFFCWHETAGVMISQQWLTGVHGIIIGALMDYFFAGTLGVTLIYFLYYFGHNRYLILKGTAISIFTWVFMCIIFIDQRISMNIKLTDPYHAYQSFIVHTLWGIVMSYLVVKYALSTISKELPEGHK